MKLFTPLFIVLLSSSAYAADEPASRPFTPLEQEERTQGRKEVSNIVTQMQAQLDALVIENESQCMKAFGKSEFCACISKEIPTGINFVQYVEIITKTKEDMKYERLPKSAKELVDSARKARDECVKGP